MCRCGLLQGRGLLDPCEGSCTWRRTLLFEELLLLYGGDTNSGMENNFCASKPQDRLVFHIVEVLIQNQVRSKKAWALEFNIPYRALLRLYSGKQSEHDVAIIMSGIALYCFREHIPPDTLFHGFAPR